MQNFDYIRVKSKDELSELLDKQNKEIKLLSGGTDLIPQLREGKKDIEIIVDVKNINEMNELSFDNTLGLYIGAAVSCLNICQDVKVKTMYPGLIDAISLIGGVQIQGRASVGGNLCNSSPAADSIPALIVHKSICIIESKDGIREVPVEQFCTGPGKNVLNKNEFLAGIRVPKVDPEFGAAYLRFIPRNEMDIAVVGVGASVEIKEGHITTARLALGAVDATPRYFDDVFEPLLGMAINDENLDRILDDIGQSISTRINPITDMRGSAEQRKHLSKVLTKRTLLKAIERASNQQEVN
ncbi:MAG: xanthine dehydrogenase family protein subunit M [Candidatus Heimdallarchaeota archaeon]|nr:xanthine dehydrogenase family protein subunit M [Candidatus Heimdallarchaeota archaeon]MDH5647101.1 xanthine dehydrogenase family protein subunit M [Candidatus Heimdallarchaeota archaeon]